MVSIHPLKSPKAATKYFGEHLGGGSTHGYMTEAGSLDGAWWGKVATPLGLVGKVAAKAFQRLCHNRRPDNNKTLTQRRKSNARPGLDITISAFKSFSIVALIGGDERLLPAHERAVTATLAFIQSLAMARVRDHGANADRYTGNLTGARFTHLTSRAVTDAPDPQVHTHAIAFNCTRDDVAGTMKALQPVEIYRQSGLATQIYRSFMARELHALGYPTVSTPKGGIEIAGIPRAMIEKVSKRHLLIDDIAADHGDVNDPKLREGIARRFRNPKDTSKTLAQLREEWLAQLSPDEIATLEAVKAKALANGPIMVEPVTASQALDMATEHLFERKSVVRDEQLFEEALAAAPGQHTLDAIKEAFQANAANYLIRGSLVTTPAALAADQRMIEFVNDGVGVCPPLAPGFTATPAFAAALAAAKNKNKKNDDDNNNELPAVIEMLLSSGDRVMGLKGPPGAGKTTALKMIKLGLHANWHDIVVCAPGAGQVDKLTQEGFIGAMTLERLLTDEKRQSSLWGEVIILDEAGLVSVRSMNRLFDLAQRRGCRILLSGDANQHKSVESGDSLRVLERRSALASARLNKNWRQKHEGYRLAVDLIKEGDFAKGFEALAGLGWILELSGEERYHQIGRDYLDARLHKQSVLVVCATWRECNGVTRRVRFYLQAKKLLSTKEHSIPVLQPLSQFTRSHLAQAHRFLPGMVVVFNRQSASKVFVRDEAVEVLGVEGEFVKVKNACGQTLTFEARKEAANISLFETATIPVAPREQLLIRRNGTSGGSHPRKLTNGELVTVEKVSPSGLITLEDGRTIPPTFRHFCHGYAITSQASQGKEADRVLIAIDAESAQAAARTETFYVAISRGKQRCTIYTDDKEALFDAAMRSGERIAAVEFLDDPQPKQPNPTPNHESEPSTNPATPTGPQPQPSPAAGVPPKQPLPALGLPAHPAGIAPFNLCYPAGGGTQPFLRPQPWHPIGRDQKSGVPGPAGVCELPGTGSIVLEAELHYPGFEGPQTALAL